MITTELMAELDQGTWNDEVDGQIKAALDDFKATGSW